MRMDSKVEQLLEREPSKTDPFGSYTGVPLDEGERPEQDADDL
jgi:hypothetical protein